MDDVIDISKLVIRYYDTASKYQLNLYKEMYQEFITIFNECNKSKHNNGIFNYKISMLFKKYYDIDPYVVKLQIENNRKIIECELYESQTGMCLGKGWHGGLTCEEWQEVYNWLIKSKEILNTLTYE